MSPAPPYIAPKIPVRLLPLLLLLLLGTLWGSTFSISKIAVLDGVPPIAYALWQCAGSALVLVMLAALRGERLRPKPSVLAYGLIAGQLGITIPNLVFYHVIAYLPAGLMAVVITCAPLVTYIGALVLAVEPPSARRVTGLAIGFVGALVLLLPGAGLPDPGLWSWLLLGFLTPVFYALNSLFSALLRPSGASSLQLAVTMLAGAAGALLPLLLLTDSGYLPGIPLGAGDWAILAQIAVSSLAYVIFFEVLRLAGPVFFSQVGYIVTLTGLLWGLVFFGERPTPGLAMAAALILGGLALVNRRPKKPAGRQS